MTTKGESQLGFLRCLLSKMTTTIIISRTTAGNTTMTTTTTIGDRMTEATIGTIEITQAITGGAITSHLLLNSKDITNSQAGRFRYSILRLTSISTLQWDLTLTLKCTISHQMRLHKQTLTSCLMWEQSSSHLRGSYRVSCRTSKRTSCVFSISKSK